MDATHFPLRVIGLAGSLREGSYNRALLHVAQELAPDDMEIIEFDIASIPMYNADLDNDELRPEPVRQLKQAIDEADGLLFALPEYNGGIPGVLKNAIDWASRPAGRSPMKGKSAATMGATTGMWGTVRAQMHMRDVLQSTGMHVVLGPMVLVAGAKNKFDDDLNLTDEATEGFISQLLDNLAEEIIRRQMPVMRKELQTSRSAPRG